MARRISLLISLASPLALTFGLTSQAVPLGHVPASNASVGTTITVDAHAREGAASRWLLGVNHHYNRNGYGLWDEAADSADPLAVARARRAGVQSLRFPGGTVASLYDWKRAIGAHRGCQVDGRITTLGGFRALRRELAWGPDEYIRSIAAIGARPLVMVPFVNQTPGDAADWVEYMNARASSPGNPNGGVDWADVRAANGHPAPYAVHRWEIGNEPQHRNARYWLSADSRTAARQYAFGASVWRKHEALGKDCAHPRDGVASDGSDSQVFEVLYPPVAPDSVSITVAGHPWRRVADLATASGDDRVFTVRARSGEVSFGDGEHGAVPPRGAAVVASYRSEHRGFFAYVRRMKAVDPTIVVCASWGNRDFPAAAGRLPYDCLTTHAISSFGADEGARWASPLEGHDQMMLAAAARRRSVARLRAALPAGVPLWLTEFSTIQGDSATFPTWATSASHAVYVATELGDWMRLRLRWAMGDDLIWGSDRAVLGPAPDFTFTADAVTRQAVRPMFDAGGSVLAAGVTGNPVRTTALHGRSYPALAVTATRGAHGRLFLLVVNRLPTRDVTARVELRRFTTRGRADVRSVRSGSFRDWNPPGKPAMVRLTTTSRAIGAHGFVQRFPATTTTVIAIRPHR